MHSCTPLIGVTLLMVGCNSSSQPTATVESDVTGSKAPAPVALQQGEALSGLFRLQIDPGMSSASIEPLREAAAQPPQALSYDLDIAKFVGIPTLAVSGFELQWDRDLLITVRHTHPFRAPNFAAPISGLNRADLSYTGRLLILADTNPATMTLPGDGPLTFDNTLVENPDGFAATGNLLRDTTLQSNLFPYRLLVDEARDNRIGISNAGIPQGNYTPASGGWQRGNAGPNANGWTGYDYLHQGQSVETSFSLDYLSVINANYEIDLAVLIKYTDPRGVGGRNARFPFEPVDTSQFAYRLPFAALDVSTCRECTQMDLPGDPHGTALRVPVRDWDVEATEGADFNLSDEADVSVIQPSGAGLPLVEAIAPALFAGPQILTFTGGTGLAGDELIYETQIENTLNLNGETHLMLRATDPEIIDPNYINYHFGVDPETIIPDANRALSPRSYLPITVRAWPQSSWARRLGDGTPQSFSGPVVTAAGTILVGTHDDRPDNDVDTSLCQIPGPHAGSQDVAFLELDASGNTINRWVWPDGSLQTVGAAGSDAAGNRYFSFAFEDPDFTWGAASCDLDPGPGSEIHDANDCSVALVKIDANGNFVWGRSFGGATHDTGGWYPAAGLERIFVAPSGEVIVQGYAKSRIDLDAGPGTNYYDASQYHDLFVIGFQPDGTSTWGVGLGGGEWTEGDSAMKPNGNLVVVLGLNDSGCDFDPGPGEFRLDVNDFRSGAHAEYTPTGTLVDAYSWNNLPTDQGGIFLEYLGIASDGRQLLGGYYGGPDVDLDPTAGIDVRPEPPSGVGMLVTSLTEANAYEWSVVYTNNDSAQFSPTDGLAVDATGGVITVADFSGGAMDLDPGPGDAIVPWTAGTKSIFWTRLDSTGNYTWHRELHPTGLGLSLRNTTVASSGRLLMSGPLFVTSDLDPGAGVHEFSPGGKWTAPVFLSLNSDGSW